MKRIAALVVMLLLSTPVHAITDNDIAGYQIAIEGKPLGERIALWAEKFVGTPYDPDPLGEYVTKKTIVADDRVDCMYLSFRTLELSLGHSPEEAVSIALDKRFMTKGVLKDGVVVNYNERFQYGEDMIDSSKWGREITRDIGPVTRIKGSRGRNVVEVVSRDTLKKILEIQRTHSPLKDGDFVFFVKSPEKRAVDEIVGHIGIIRLEGGVPYLIHAGGRKNKGGKVQKVLFDDYVNSMPFAGVRVSRFD